MTCFMDRVAAVTLETELLESMVEDRAREVAELRGITIDPGTPGHPKYLFREYETDVMTADYKRYGGWCNTPYPEYRTGTRVVEAFFRWEWQGDSDTIRVVFPADYMDNASWREVERPLWDAKLAADAEKAAAKEAERKAKRHAQFEKLKEEFDDGPSE